MSWTETEDPHCQSCPTSPGIEKLIDAKPRHIDGFSVGRVLPTVGRRAVGPFVFLDHMGPAEVTAGEGMDVRPHPHINLATVTYLFEGQILHRDSVGSEQIIGPGAINWMTAGRGIAHSERTPAALRETGFRLHGLQLWVALPREHEEVEPSFQHHPAHALPVVEKNGAALRVLAGSAYDVTSPVRTLSRLCFVEVRLAAGAVLELPNEVERAIYVIEGSVRCGSELAQAGRMWVFAAGGPPVVCAETAARFVFIGGEPLDGSRNMWWNFVSSSKERIEQAKKDWSEGRFPKIPGDDQEFIPLPGSL